MTYMDPSVSVPSTTSEPNLEAWPLTEDVTDKDDDTTDVELSPQMTRALIMMVEGKKTSDIAEELGVHRATIYRWTTDSAFQRELNLYRDRLIQETFGLQILASKRATLRLVELIDDEDGRVALSAIKAAAPLKEAYVSLDRERRVRFMEDNLDGS